MSMKEINALRHRGEGDEIEVYLRRGKHRGWVRKAYLVAWLVKHNKLRFV